MDLVRSFENCFFDVSKLFRPEYLSLVSFKVPSSNSIVGGAVLCELNNLNSLSTQDNF